MFSVALSVALFVAGLGSTLSYEHYKSVLADSEKRRRYIWIWEELLWEKNFRGFLGSVIHIYEAFEVRRAYIFIALAAGYVVVIFSVSWVFGSNGSFLGLQIFPKEIENWAYRIFYAFIIIGLFYGTCKLLQIADWPLYNLFIGHAFIALLIGSVWFYVSGDFTTGLIWFLLSFGSKILALEAAAAYYVLTKYNIESAVPLVFVIFVVVSILSVFRITEFFRQRPEFALEPLWVGLTNILLFLALLVALSGIPFDTPVTIGLIPAILTSGTIFLLQRVFSSPTTSRNVGLNPVLLLVPAGIYFYGAFSFAEGAFGSSNVCYAIEPQILGFFALLIIFPVSNAAVDYISFKVSMFLLRDLKAKPEGRAGLAFDVAIHVAFDYMAAIACMFILLVTTTAALVIFENVVTNEGCEPTQLLSLLGNVIDDPWSVESRWFTVALATTLIPSLVHFFVASRSVSRMMTLPRNQAKVIKFLKSSSSDDEMVNYISRTFVLSFLGAAISVPFFAFSVVGTFLYIFSFAFEFIVAATVTIFR